MTHLAPVTFVTAWLTPPRLWAAERTALPFLAALDLRTLSTSTLILGRIP